MKKLGILIFDEVEVLDFAGPFEVFSVANQLSNYQLLQIHTLSIEEQKIHAKNGLQLVADQRLEQVARLDYLVLPGGDGSKFVIQNQLAVEKLQNLIQHARWTMSVCSGARILGKAGFLDKKPYCTHREVFGNMQEIVPTGIPQPSQRYVQSDARIWTSAGVSAGIDLALHLTKLTFGEDLALKTATYMEYLPYLEKHAS